MKSDVVKVTKSGEGVQDALSAAAASAAYRALGRKDALHLRLLAEETLGMLQQITGGTEAEFWVESEGARFELHLVAHPAVTGSMRKELLKASSSGRNAAAKGFMGKLRNVFDQALIAQDMGEMSGYYALGLVTPGDMYMADAAAYEASVNMVTWSMNRYKTAVADESAHSTDARQEWDELERSIVANIADEVEIAIVGDRVEMTVYKNF